MQRLHEVLAICKELTEGNPHGQRSSHRNSYSKAMQLFIEMDAQYHHTFAGILED